MTASTAARRSGNRWSGGTRNGTPAALILRLARTSRWAIVASGTRNARAISVVVRPPSVRSVRATCPVQGQGRMAAGEDELQALVGDGGLVHGWGRRFEPADLLVEHPHAADAIDRAVARGGHEPRARVGRNPVALPPRRGDREGVLRGLLGEIEVAEEADQGREDATPLVAEDPLERSYHSLTGRTSIAPPMRADGIFAATSMAASRSSASTTQ